MTILVWPLQQCPPAAAWEKWNLFISHISSWGHLRRLQSIYQRVTETSTWLKYHSIAPITQQCSTQQTKHWFQIGTRRLGDSHVQNLLPTTLTYDVQHNPTQSYTAPSTSGFLLAPTDPIHTSI